MIKLELHKSDIVEAGFYCQKLPSRPRHFFSWLTNAGVSLLENCAWTFSQSDCTWPRLPTTFPSQLGTNVKTPKGIVRDFAFKLLWLNSASPTHFNDFVILETRVWETSTVELVPKSISGTVVNCSFSRKSIKWVFAVDLTANRVTVRSINNECTRFGRTHNKTGTMSRRLAWALCKNDTQICEVFQIKKKKKWMQ